MKLKLIREDKGNIAYMVTWIGRGNFITTKDYNTKKEVLKQYEWLKGLGIQSIAIYRRCKVEE